MGILISDIQDILGPKLESGRGIVCKVVSDLDYCRVASALQASGNLHLTREKKLYIARHTIESLHFPFFAHNYNTFHDSEIKSTT